MVVKYVQIKTKCMNIVKYVDIIKEIENISLIYAEIVCQQNKKHTAVAQCAFTSQIINKNKNDLEIQNTCLCYCTCY